MRYSVTGMSACRGNGSHSSDDGMLLTGDPETDIFFARWNCLYGVFRFFSKLEMTVFRFFLKLAISIVVPSWASISCHHNRSHANAVASSFSLRMVSAKPLTSAERGSSNVGCMLLQTPVYLSVLVFNNLHHFCK